MPHTARGLGSAPRGRCTVWDIGSAPCAVGRVHLTARAARSVVEAHRMDPEVATALADELHPCHRPAPALPRPVASGRALPRHLEMRGDPLERARRVTARVRRLPHTSAVRRFHRGAGQPRDAESNAGPSQSPCGSCNDEKAGHRAAACVRGRGGLRRSRPRASKVGCDGRRKLSGPPQRPDGKILSVGSCRSNCMQPTEQQQHRLPGARTPRLTTPELQWEACITSRTKRCARCCERSATPVTPLLP